MKVKNESVKKLMYIITFLMFVSPVLALNMDIINLTNVTLQDPLENVSNEPFGSYQQTYDDLVPGELTPKQQTYVYIIIAFYLLLLFFCLRMAFKTYDDNGKREEKDSDESDS